MSVKPPDEFNSVNFPAPPEHKTTNQEMTKQAEKAASLGSTLSATGGKTSSQIPVKREQIPTSGESSEVKFTHVSLAKMRLNSAADKLFREKGISPGRTKFLESIIEAPGQLEKDIRRLGSINVGDRHMEHSYYAKHEASTVYKFLSAFITGYVKDENPELHLNSDKVDEILNSVVQTFSNDIFIAKHDELPKDPWMANGKNTTMEASFKMEDKWFGAPNVLIASVKTSKLYENIDEPSLKPKEVILETQIKHNLKTNDIQFVYRLSIDGKQEEWDPTLPSTKKS